MQVYYAKLSSTEQDSERSMTVCTYNFMSYHFHSCVIVRIFHARSCKRKHLFSSSHLKASWSICILFLIGSYFWITSTQLKNMVPHSNFSPSVTFLQTSGLQNKNISSERDSMDQQPGLLVKAVVWLKISMSWSKYILKLVRFSFSSYTLKN